jgi:hypothetical protein
MTAARPERTVALAVGGLLALLFIGMAGFHAVSWTLGTATRTQHRVIRGASGIDVVDSGHADVVVEAGTGPDVTVDTVARGSFRAPRLDVAVDGSSIRLAGGCGPVIFGHCQAAMTVRVPAGAAVTLHSGEGDLHLDGLSGPVRVDAGAGDISASELSGPVALQTGSGDIDAHDLTGAVTLASSSGDVAGDGLSGARAKASSGDGDVELLFSGPPSTADVETGSGDVTVVVPRGPAYSVDAVSASGDRSGDVASTPGADHAIRARTGSGDVAVTYG